MRIESSSLPAFRGRELMPFHAGGSIRRIRADLPGMR